MKHSESNWKTLENRRELKTTDADENYSCRARIEKNSRVIGFEDKITLPKEKN